VAFVAAMGFVLTSTAIVMQIIEERGVAASEPAQRLVAILLLEDLAIVPLLAIVALLEPAGAVGTKGARWADVAVALGTLAALVAAGFWMPQPAVPGARPIRGARDHDAAALLVVLGAALLMQLGGLSMAMGAFLAGVLLSESTFRHQLEAEIEPFRGLLPRPVLPRRRHGPRPERDRHRLAVGAALGAGFMTFKAAAIYAGGPADRRGRREAVYRERPHGPGRRVRLRALQQRRRRRHLRRAHERHLHHGGDRLDGADAAGDGRRHAADPEALAVDEGVTSPTGWSAACS
jgi:glutathione-regulated potassium-efflux system protein KefB